MYPIWKTWLWRLLRTGIAGGCGAIVAITIILKPDLSNMQSYGVALLAAFIAGFIAAAAKAGRDIFGNEEKDSVVDKLPV